MKRFILEQSDDEFYTAHSGLALVGQCINRYTGLDARVRRLAGEGGEIPHADVLRSYLGLLCCGKSDFEAITDQRNDAYFRHALDLDLVPSASTLRQRMDQQAAIFQRVIDHSSMELLANAGVTISTLSTGHVPVDMDVFPMDNSGTKKEGVSMAYDKTFGYAPIAAYIGREGWCLEIELRPGSQHSQNNFLPFLDRVLVKARRLTDKELLVRLDSAHDALETRGELHIRDGVFYIVKWNPRSQDPVAWRDRVFAEGEVSTLRPGKRVAILTIKEKKKYKGVIHEFVKVVRVTERTIDKHGQFLLRICKIITWPFCDRYVRSRCKIT